MEELSPEKEWISLLLRLAVASLFIGAVIPKFQGGLGNVVQSFQTLFQNSWLPMPLVKLHARLTPWIELLIPIWLLVGIRLRWAWILTGLFLVSLSFGMVVAGQGAVAATNYSYLLLACAGLYFSPFDRYSVDGMRGAACCGGGSCH